MKRNLIIIAIILCGYGVAFSFAPPIPIPVPPPAIGPRMYEDPAGSRKNTHVLQDISEDVGLICDVAGVCASRAWWAYKASNTVPATILGSIATETKNKLENTYYGIKDWLTYDLDDLLDKFDDSPTSYPTLNEEIGPYYTPPTSGAPPLGESFTTTPGGRIWWRYPEDLEVGLWDYSQAITANIPRGDQVSIPTDDWITAIPSGISTEGPVTQVACSSDPSRQCYRVVLNYYWDWMQGSYHRATMYWRHYQTPVIDLPSDDAPVRPPPVGTWNIPGVNNALNQPGVQTDPAVKEDIGNLIKNNPGIADPSHTKLTDAEIAQIVQAIKADIATTNAELAQQIADSTGTIADKISANDALKDAIEEEEDKNANIDTPVFTDAARHQWQYQEQLSPLIQDCTGIGCKFPFDLITSFKTTWNELVEDPITPEFDYILNGITYKITLANYEDMATKFRLFLAWIIYLITAVYVIRLYGK